MELKVKCSHEACMDSAEYQYFWSGKQLFACLRHAETMRNYGHEMYHIDPEARIAAFNESKRKEQ